MNNKVKYIIVVVSLALGPIISQAQGAYSDLQYALEMSQLGANMASTGNLEKAASYSSHAFDGSGGYYVSSYSPDINTGIEWAKFCVNMRTERTKLIEERRNKKLVNWLKTVYEGQDKRESSLLVFVANNSQAKPLTEEVRNELESNGLSGNVIIDDDGTQYRLPEVLLEGAGDGRKALEEKLISMTYAEIGKFEEELKERCDKGENLSNEELEFLVAWEKQREAMLKEKEKSELALKTFEEKLSKMNEKEKDIFKEELEKRLDNGEELSDEEYAFLYARERQRELRLEEENVKMQLDE